jgi:hypothetical protein
LSKDLKDIKAFVKEVIEGNLIEGKEQSSDEDLRELSAIIPKELDRVESKKAKLEAELKSV